MVPCGTCVVLDDGLGPTLRLHGGLDIQGRLVVPDSFRIEIQTPYIRIQGILSMSASKAVDGEPNVKVALVAGEFGIQKFQPALSNAHASGVQRCDQGPGSIFVAGGELGIRGLPETAPAWVKLYDVVPVEEPPPLKKAEACSSKERFIVEDFASGLEPLLSGTAGATVAFEESSVVITNRVSPYHGIQVDLQPFRECLRVDESYMLSMRFRLNREGLTGTLTDCAGVGINCVEIHSEVMRRGEVFESAKKYEGPKLDRFEYGEWVRIDTVVSFDEEELDPANAYLILRVGGGGAGINLELDDFRFT